jgi:hypothetical protein
MKKNLSLFSVLIFLLLMTYFFQEKRLQRQKRDENKRDTLISSDFAHLKLPNLEAIKKKEQWWDGDHLLSHNTFRQIEKKLSEIKKIKEIKGDWKSYFSRPFIFEIDHIQWTLGDLSLDKQAFYISKDKKIYLALIEGESTHLTRNESEIASIKLQELISSLSKTRQDLRETQLFRFYPDLPLNKIVLEMDGNLPFELDLINNTTGPPPISGVFPHHKLKEKFYSLLTQATIRFEIPYSEKLKFKKLGQMSFLNKNGATKWELWLKDNKSADVIIIDSDKEKAFLMAGGSLKVFFVNIQDYWDKKVIPQKDFISFTRLKSRFTQGAKSAEVFIINKEPFDFETSSHKINKEKMEEIIQIIFNLGPKEQASRVSILSNSERKQLLSGNHLRIEVMGQELILWRKIEELIVANLSQDFKAHFSIVDENFRGTFEDVLK